MTLSQLKSKVGEDVYLQACREAWESAPDTGSLQQWEARKPTPAFDLVLSEIGFNACDAESDVACVSFFTDLYREMPAYGLLHQLFIARAYGDLDLDARRLFWSFAREMLSGEAAALADPVAYYMWCHFFEDQWVEEAWKALTLGAPDRLIERILLVSGPVPFSIKRDLYQQKIGNKRWHYFIYRGLLHSAFDVYGKIDRAEARRLIGRLKLSLSKEESKNFDRLSRQLGD